MKKLVIIFSLFFVATSLFSQQDPALWKANPEKLKGAKIIINAEKAPNNSSSFFIDNPNLTKYGSRYFNARRKGARASFQADNSALLGKEYEIMNVVKSEREYEHPVLGALYVFFINDPSYGDIFIEAFANSNSAFLVVSGLEAPPENEIYCSDFYESYDKFEKSTTIYTSIGLSKKIGLFKIEGEFESYKIRLESYGLEPFVGEKGVKMIFDDGEILDYPDVEIDIDVNTEYSSGYDYSAYVEIDEELHQKLYNNLLTDYRLYIFDGLANGEILNKKYKCLIDETYILKK